MTKKPPKRAARNSTLRPVPDRPGYYAEIEKALIRFMRGVYRPIIAELEKVGITGVLKNSASDLIAAIRSGRIHHERGAFRGSFDAAVSREIKRLGGKWDRRTGSFKILLKDLPLDVRSEISVSAAKFDQAVTAVKRRLDAIVPEKLSEELALQPLYDRSIYDMSRHINKSLNPLEVEVKITPETRKKISEEYTNNMKLYITDFLEKNIPKLRKDVEDVVLAGYRTDALKKKIQHSYGTSEEKAKFLARQESRLLLASYHQAAMEDAGVDKYIWRCVIATEEHPVRPWHKKHDGKIFSWDNPPQVNDQGDHKHPMQDYNCRCIAVPYIGD